LILVLILLLILVLGLGLFTLTLHQRSFFAARGTFLFSSLCPSSYTQLVEFG
jgi:hypothetical protein